MSRFGFYLRFCVTKRHMKVAFITGVTGQDGAYLSEFLLKKGPLCLIQTE